MAERGQRQEARTASSSSPTSMTCRSSARRSSTSSAGFGLVKHQVDAMKARQPYMMLDAIADFRELTDIKIKAGHHRPADDRRRRAEELHPGHRRLRRDPRPRRRRGAQIRGADHRRRRARRRLLVLDAPGGGELGQGLDRDGADGVRRGDHASSRCSPATPGTAAPGATARSAASPSCSTRRTFEPRRPVRGGSGISSAPVSATITAPIMYQPGATGLPVQRISKVSNSCVVPPKIAIASA